MTWRSALTFTCSRVKPQHPYSCRCLGDAVGNLKRCPACACVGGGVGGLWTEGCINTGRSAKSISNHGGLQSVTLGRMSAAGREGRYREKHKGSSRSIPDISFSSAQTAATTEI